MNLTAQFKEHWGRKANDIKAQVLLAVSGGLDSMVMAHLFHESEIAFAVAHCNFGLRGDESDGDEDFVKRWCDKNSIPFFVAHFNTQEKAAATGKSIQETARDLRYKWFTALAKQYHFAAICTAHHADDNAETMLMHLCRGTGIAGLHGIPERNGLIIRPLLFATRASIQGYADQHRILYREDSSNTKDNYLRNAIRHHILPVIEQYMPGASGRILDTSRRIKEAEDIYLKGIDNERKKLLQPRGKDCYIPVKLLRHRTPLATILYELLAPYGFSSQQVPFALTLLGAESSKHIASPTHRLIRHGDFLIITTIAQQDADMLLLEELKTVSTPEGEFSFTPDIKIPEQLDAGASVAYIDAAKMEQPVILRRRKTGDYFYPLGMGMKKKKVSRFLTDLKIPAHQKESVWVLEANKRIVWIAGYRLDERFKVTAGTKKIVRIKFTGAGTTGASSAG